jgi:hypothetical protein
MSRHFQCHLPILFENMCSSVDCPAARYVTPNLYERITWRSSIDSNSFGSPGSLHNLILVTGIFLEMALKMSTVDGPKRNNPLHHEIGTAECDTLSLSEPWVVLIKHLWLSPSDIREIATGPRCESTAKKLRCATLNKQRTILTLPKKVISIPDNIFFCLLEQGFMHSRYLGAGIGCLHFKL